MFNTSFSNKIQLKIKKIIFLIFIFPGQTRFNAFLALDRTWSGRNSGECLHCSVIPPPTRSTKCCFYKTCGTAAKLVGPTSINHYFFLNQTVIFVAAGEPHPQPHCHMSPKLKAYLTRDKTRKQ